ncbi:DNA polymerase I [subsurface metagenome]
MLTEKEKLTLIDGTGLLYRAYYALPPLSNTQGVPTGAVYGFTRMLMKLLKEKKPEYCACAFDKGRKTFRHKKFKEYKITRPRMPEDLASQIPLIKKILTGFGVPIFEDEEYEADDILAALAKEGVRQGLKVEILTQDKDILQIVASSVHIIRLKKGISQTDLFDEERVRANFGISPSQIADYLSLVGDVSDNIPGVPGVGPAMAKELLQKYGDLENLICHLDDLPTSKRKLLKKYQDQAKRSKELITLISSIPLKVNWEKFRVESPDKKVLLPLFRELGFKKLMEDFTASRPHNSECRSIKSPQELNELTLILKQGPFVLQTGKEPPGVAFFSKDGICYWLLLLQKELPKDLIIKKISPIFQDPQIKKIGHNLKKIILDLKEWELDLKGLGFDTQLAAYLLNPLASDYSLKDLCIEYLGESMDEVSPPERVELIHKLKESLEEKLKEENLWELYTKVELPLIDTLAKMESRGIKVKRSALEGFLSEVREKIRRLEGEIYEEVGEKFNINSSKQLGQILFEKLNLPPVKKIKTGYSTNEEVLQTLCLIRPSLKKILDYRQLFKLESTYIRPFPGLINPRTGRIHTSFNQTVTATGRLSSSQPNLQNIPIRNKFGEKFRQAFIAEEGNLFLSADYSQIELRILAHLSGDPNLKKAFDRNEDIHQQTAAEIFNVLPLQLTSQMRRLAKVVNFGIVYGISSYGLARDLGISQKEAEEYIQHYFQRYPQVKEYLGQVVKKAREKGYVRTLLGRKRYLPGILSSERKRREMAERAAINTPIQGGAADLIKLAMVNLEKRFREEELRTWIILQIHDELIFEVPEREIDETRRIVKEEMEGAMKLSVPLVVETKVGKNWAEMSS